MACIRVDHFSINRIFRVQYFPFQMKLAKAQMITFPIKKKLAIFLPKYIHPTVLWNRTRTPKVLMP